MCAHWRIDGGVAMRLLRSRARVRADADTQVEGQVERTVEIFSRVEDEIRDFICQDLAASRHRLEECSDLRTANVASLSDNVVQEIDQLNAELQALRHRLQHEATRVEREVVQYASLTEAARASMQTISESLSFWQKQ
jgi:vacuolar-type H+-ATPase subunit I/STV1